MWYFKKRKLQNQRYGISKELHENIDMRAIEYARQSIRLEVCPSRKMRNQRLEYFRVTDNQYFEDFTKIARISIREPRYILHNDNDGKEIWTLSTLEKENLLKILKSKTKDPKMSITVWEEIIIDYNRKLGLELKDTLENTMSNLKHPKYLPIDLPIPDYTQLKP